MGPQTHLFMATLMIILFLFFSSFLDCCYCKTSSSSSSSSSKQQKRISSIFDKHHHHHGHEMGGVSSHVDSSLSSSSPNKKALVDEISVDDFGAKADGKTDDSKAFKKAWKEACRRKASSAATATVIVVPENRTYLLKPIKFSGPCKSKNITMKIDGTIEASTKRSDYKKDRRHWLEFENIQNIIVEGDGTINGNGEIWWKNSCKLDKSKPCTHAPTSLTFSDCNNLIVRNLNMIDAPQMHLIFDECVNVEALNLRITAPEKSPNTDGIHVTKTQNIQILDSVIQTGDDCISIVSGTENVQAVNITCGPGHGISIGSLGADKSEAHVSNVMVNGAKLNGTTNGVRIKTWQGGSGSANNITFQNIIMYNVENPIIIDQNYCDQDDACKEQESAVEISNVLYKNIKGTSASKIAVKFDCSEQHPCQGIVLQDINLVREDDDEKAAKASCKNVEWTKIGKVMPSCMSSLKESLGIVTNITTLESN